MNSYLLTLTFLTIMSLLTASEMVRLVEGEKVRHLYAQYQKESLLLEEAKEEAALADFRALPIPEKEEREKKPSSPHAPANHPAPLRVHQTRPPNNARLNVYALLYEIRGSQDSFSLYEIAARLLRLLYGELPAFRALPHAEYALLDELIRKREETLTFTYPDALATLTFSDPELQKLWIALLKGTEGKPSLLNYLTFDRGNGRPPVKINLLFAPAPVLEALFNAPSLTQKLLLLRAPLVEEIFYQEAHRLTLSKEEGKSRTLFKEELRKGYEALIQAEGLSDSAYHKWLDFSLGKMGTILYIEEPSTGYVHREKYVPLS